MRTLNLELVAILLDNGEIVLGSNQENAAYPQDFAQNVAIFHAGAIYPTAKF
jgi:cytidine deaminase